MPTIPQLSALAGGLLVCGIALGIWFWLRRRGRSTGAHSERRSEVPATVPVAPRQQGPTPPVSALITYTKADGTTRERSLLILSRDAGGGKGSWVNCRADGEQMVKTFLLHRISRLELPTIDPPMVLTDQVEIRAWLERHIPERQARPPKGRPTSRPEPRTEPVRPLGARTPPPSPPPAPAPPQPQPQPQPQPALAKPLASLLPDGALGFAVLDLETTGVGRNCRILEIALVRLDPEGRITEEWDTLVHPGIPIPNAHVHGINDAAVEEAPRFEQIAGVLATKLHAHVLVAHNLHSFDGPILEAHFTAVEGLELSLGRGIDTMPRRKEKLADLCSRHGVELAEDEAHTALGDARALALALQGGMAHLTAAGELVTVHRNHLPDPACTPVTRAMAPSGGSNANWTPIELQLEPGQIFHATGPQTLAKDTEIRRAEAHGSSLGLTYQKVSTITLKSPAAFLLSTSLELTSSKMATARKRQIPVVLTRDLMQAGPGAVVRAWVHRQVEGGESQG